ncbi:ATP-dependent helicase [Sediminispirochaeta bajacaliforniensis]|uniref:ATP-dependent helicase n=1 Tax=Sediminispirochaeta bajacaliforniensis TaxID=148 RepID=UPI000366E4F0|nr:UvrD-helicase domain-containing protein [Sediminispirochaeta bajacaliforniensis]
MAIDLAKELNKEQFIAASTIDGPLLIIAGAGSGKTRMITFRIAHMLEEGIPQSSILALTFTNKAAREMSDRIRSLTGKRLSNLTVSTFHAFGVKVLRKSIEYLDYKSNFSIYDQVDKTALIKESARGIGMIPEDLDTWEIANLFSSVKTGREKWNRENKLYKPLFEEYLANLHAYNAVDFDDLIMLPIRLFEEFPEVLDAYRHRYRYIMVDEFQDTSLAQYHLMKLLAEKERNICVVGDDDQSIYSWRGANYQNIVNFEKDFPELLEIKLEQNYRSTGNILAAANQVIANNKNRKSKELWTGLDNGKSIEIFYPDDDLKESEFIAQLIATLSMREGYKYHDFGVLVRTNSLAATIENAFLAENIPYKVSGGQSFFQRKEIKDIIAYLRVLSNPDDDVNLLRIINTPRRGIGRVSLEKLRELADEKEWSLYSAASAIRYAEDAPVSDKVKAALGEFVTFIEYYREQILTGKKMADTTRSLVDKVDYWGYLIMENQKNERAARWKYKNIGIFLDLFERWEKDPDNDEPNIYNYLNRITLITRDDDQEENNDMVNLMTVHASKGLEFEIVFLAGVEDTIMPHARSLEEDPDNIEEERRLFYVAITRAKQKLYLTSCKTRRVSREVIDSSPSRFLEEIPDRLIEYHQPEEEVESGEAMDYFEKIRAKLGIPDKV